MVTDNELNVPLSGTLFVAFALFCHFIYATKGESLRGLFCQSECP